MEIKKSFDLCYTTYNEQDTKFVDKCSPTPDQTRYDHYQSGCGQTECNVEKKWFIKFD